MNYCILIKNNSESQIIAQKLRTMIHFVYDEDKPDIVICVGGDGTILRALHKYENRLNEIVFFGLHTGSLGFFTNYKAEEYSTVASLINSKSFNVEEIDILSYKIITDEYTLNGIALNEVTIVNPPRTLILDVFIDGFHLETFRGTGLCISTPYGSTAYNKSLHGSVIDPQLKSIQLTEIASINSNAYRTLGSPIVLNSNRVIRLVSNEATKLFVNADNKSYEITSLREVKIFNDGKSVKMAMSKEQTYFKRIKRTFIEK